MVCMAPEQTDTGYVKHFTILKLNLCKVTKFAPASATHRRGKGIIAKRIRMTSSDRSLEQALPPHPPPLAIAGSQLRTRLTHFSGVSAPYSPRFHTISHSE